jgi:hypothetical protein
MVNLQYYKTFDKELLEYKVWRFYNDNTEEFEVVVGQLVDLRVFDNLGKDRHIKLIFKDKSYITRRDLSFTQIYGFSSIEEFVFYSNSSDYVYNSVAMMNRTIAMIKRLIDTSEPDLPIKPKEDYSRGDIVYIIRHDHNLDYPVVVQSVVSNRYKNEIITPDFYYHFSMITEDDYQIGSTREEVLSVNRRLLIKNYEKYKKEADIANKFIKDNIKLIVKVSELE